jgi:hypothetical protein
MRDLKLIERLIESGEIHLKLTRDELFPLLGSPDDVGGTSRKFCFPCIWKYGEVQFVFPSARNATEATGQGLTYVYIDESEERDEPRFLPGPA